MERLLFNIDYNEQLLFNVDYNDMETTGEGIHVSGAATGDNRRRD